MGEKNVVKLEDVCEFFRGLTYSKKNETTFSDKIVLRASNIDLDTSTLVLHDLKYLKENFVIPDDKKLQKDCIFICMSSGSKSHLGKVAYIARDYDYAFGGFMGLIKPKTNILPKYLFYLLQTPEYKELIKKLSNGININNIKFSDLKEFQFELPSLEEQEKILNILDKADEIRTKKRLANDKLDEFLKSTFIDMFGDPVKNPKLYTVEKLEKHIKVIGGYAFKSSLFKEEGIPVLRIGNINTGKLKMDNVVYWDKDSNLAKYMLYPNDLVISLTGTVGKDDYGNVCILPSTCPCYYLNQRNAKLVVNNNINTYYLCHLLKNKDVKSKLTGISRGVRQANISNSDILNLEIALPPIEEQNKFAKIVEKVEAQKQKNELVIEQMDNLFNSLSQRAFKGDMAKSNVIDLLTRQVALHSKIIDKCNSHQTFGAVKLEKIFNLCDMIQELNLVPNGYYRKAAGPYVPEMRHTVEQELLQNNWVKITNQGNGKKVEYKKDANFVAYKAVYNQIFNDKNQEIENIINYFYDKDTNYCEAFSTLYMCWNDLILEGKNPTKTEIIDEFKNHWAPEKQRFERIYLLEILSDMSNQGFEPQGHGVHTIESNYNHNKDQLSLQLK